MLNREISNKTEDKKKESQLVEPIVNSKEEETIEEVYKNYEKSYKESFEIENEMKNDSNVEEKGTFFQKKFQILLVLAGIGTTTAFYTMQDNTVSSKESIVLNVTDSKEDKTHSSEELSLSSAQDNKVFIPLTPAQPSKLLAVSQELKTAKTFKEKKSFDEERIRKELEKLEGVKIIKRERVASQSKHITPAKVFIRSKVATPKRVKYKPKKARIVTIRKGDTLASLAEKFYGNAMDFKHIIYANSSIKNSKSRLYLGRKIKIPYLKRHKSRKFVIVRRGHTLASISKKFYGNVNKIQDIVRANYKLKNQNSTLQLGQKIYLPK